MQALFACLVLISFRVGTAPATRLAACLGQPLAAYKKAFGSGTTAERKLPRGSETVVLFRTLSAVIEVSQRMREKAPMHVAVHFGRKANPNWKQALAEVGLSTRGVEAGRPSPAGTRLIGVKVACRFVAETLFTPAQAKGTGGPILYIGMH